MKRFSIGTVRSRTTLGFWLTVDGFSRGAIVLSMPSRLWFTFGASFTPRACAVKAGPVAFVYLAKAGQ